MTAAPQVHIRRATLADAPICGQICFDAFSTLNAVHGFPCDFPSPEFCIAILTALFSHPSFYCIVAELDGRIVGSNCLDERSTIFGVGPITVDPRTQNHGLGRKLMQAVIDRAHSRNASGIRLVQAAFHNRTLSLYTSLGFDIREPLACVQGTPHRYNLPGYTVRAADPADLTRCNTLSLRIHGFDRSAELSQAIQQGTARVVLHQDRITAYATDLAFFSHATAESNHDLQLLIASVETFGGPGILVPTRNTALLRWCLSNGLRIVQPMNLMTIGLYNEPAGAWLPSVSF
jgi:predicted N-acetyltransferase YhbS